MVCHLKLITHCNASPVILLYLTLPKLIFVGGYFYVNISFTFLVAFIMETFLMECVFKVRGRTAKGWGDFSEAVYAVTGHVCKCWFGLTGHFVTWRFTQVLGVARQ